MTQSPFDDALGFRSPACVGTVVIPSLLDSLIQLTLYHGPTMGLCFLACQVDLGAQDTEQPAAALVQAGHDQGVAWTFVFNVQASIGKRARWAQTGHGQPPAQ